MYCGQLIDPVALLVELETRKAGATASFGLEKRLFLFIPIFNQKIEVDVHRPGGVILGRSDPQTGYEPDVDLKEFNAERLGVSRQHARIDLDGYMLRLTDLGSTNSTFLNGLRLIPHRPCVLRASDEIRLGHLKLQVVFAGITAEAVAQAVSGAAAQMAGRREPATDLLSQRPESLPVPDRHDPTTERLPQAADDSDAARTS